MVEKIRVGIVGTSWFAENMHIVNLKAHPGADLVAICGRNRARAGEMATKYAIPQIFSNYHEMFAHGHLQAVVIVTPDDLHYPVSMAALEAGLHVLCEKPLAMNAAQAKAMLEKAQAAGVKHMSYLNNRRLPVYQYTHQLIEQGYIGKCYQINIRYDADWGPDFMWAFDNKRSNGILSNFGSHVIDLARWFVGDITHVAGELSAFINRTAPDGQPVDLANDAAVLLLRFANGAQGCIQLSAVAKTGNEAHQQHIILNGEEGTLEVRSAILGNTTGIRGIRKGENEFHPIETPAELFGANPPTDSVERWLRNGDTDGPFIDTILYDRVSAPSFYEGYKAQQVIDAVKESHQQGRWVAIE
jgi:predicted dehydrogenase